MSPQETFILTEFELLKVIVRLSSLFSIMGSCYMRKMLHHFWNLNVTKCRVVTDAKFLVPADLATYSQMPQRTGPMRHSQAHTFRTKHYLL